MSIPALQWAWAQDGLSGTEKNVLVALAYKANGDGDAIWPSIETLVSMTSLSRSTVVEVRGRLEKRGLIERTGITRYGVIEWRIPELGMDREPDSGNSQGVREPDTRGPGAGREQSGSRTQKGHERSTETSEGGVQKSRSPNDSKSRTPSEVWDHYVAVMSPRRTELDKESVEIITAALKVATVEECNQAIDGCAASPFHMGQNDKRRKFNGLSQILKGKRAGGPRSTAVTTRERIDFFIDIAEKAHIAADPEGERLAKQYVRDAWEFPGDSDVVERGEEGVRWLAEHGIKVTEDPSDTNRLGTPRPRFVVA